MAEQTPVAVVTGATSGIGRWIALGLARAGMRVVLVGRDAARGAATRTWLAGHLPGAATEFVRADLSLLAEARAAGEAIAARHPRLAVLVNNAGLVTGARRLTAEGREMVLAVNHLAPHVLTGALEGALRAGAPSRIVNTGSAASDNARLHLDDLELARGWGILRAYGQSKLALMMDTFERARRLEGTGVVAHVVHPGVVATKIAKLPGLPGLVWTLGMPFMLSPQQGADTPVFVATDRGAGALTGRYWKRRREARPNPLAGDASLRARLWEMTERLVGEATQRA